MRNNKHVLKWFYSSAFFFLLNAYGFSQEPVKVFKKDSITTYLNKKKENPTKTIPEDYRDAIRTALLYFPELDTTRISFKLKAVRTPLAASPKILSVFFRRGRRRYNVIISNKTTEKLTPILLANLSFNAQVGVIGHELSHISEYESKRSWFFIRLFVKHLNRKQMDRFEYNTDKKCIEHALGYQLLSWSKEVREKLHLNGWGGATNPMRIRERYMNPETIKMQMQLLPIYKLSK